MTTQDLRAADSTHGRPTPETRPSIRRALRLGSVLALTGVLAACGGGSNEAAVDGAAANAASAGALAASRVDQSSLEFFRVSVGDRVFFPTDQTALSAQAQAVLDRQAAWLQQNGAVRVRIEGHADERGTREYNLALGARRANAVMAYLASKGVAQNRMEAVTFGRERPTETCAAEACWAQNRRAVTAPQ